MHDRWPVLIGWTVALIVSLLLWAAVIYAVFGGFA